MQKGKRSDVHRSTVAIGRGLSVVILKRSGRAVCSVAANEHEAITNYMEDLELIALCVERETDPTIKVSIDDL